MNKDLYSLHIFWNHIRNIFETELSSGLSNSEEEIVKGIYKKLEHFYNTSLIISDKVDKMFPWIPFQIPLY